MALKISSGDLTERVVLKQPASSLNNEGGIEYDFDSPETEIETWAMIDKPNVKRTTEALAEVLVQSLDFYVRKNSNTYPITKDWIVEYDGEQYTINEVDKFIQENYIRITAKVRTDG